MNQFESELKNGRFVCSECPQCSKLVWPPSDFCNICFSKVKWRPMTKKGKLIEFSKKDNVFFCIAEFENTVRVMGELETGLKSPSVGQDIDLVKCDYIDKERFFFQLN